MFALGNPKHSSSDIVPKRARAQHSHTHSSSRNTSLSHVFPHNTLYIVVARARRSLHFFTFTSSRQDAQPPVPWRHTAGGADNIRRQQIRATNKTDATSPQATCLRLLMKVCQRTGSLGSRKFASPVRQVYVLPRSDAPCRAWRWVRCGRDSSRY